MICVECGASVSDLYKEYSKGNIRLTRCEECHNLADKYVEHEVILIFLDMLLLRTQVYRHLLFNAFEFRTLAASKLVNEQLPKIFVMCLFFDAYILWAQWRASHPEEEDLFCFAVISLKSVIELITYILTLVVVINAKALLSHQTDPSEKRSGLPVKFVEVWRAIAVSNFSKPFVLLMVVWNYTFDLYLVLKIFALVSNMVAIAVLSKESTINSSLSIFAAFCTQTVVRHLLSMLVGC